MQFQLTRLIMVYFGMVTTEDEGLDKCQRYDKTIQTFSASDCKLMFEFKKTDLLRLLPLLRFPEECTFDNRSKMAGEEVFLRGLYELVSAANKHAQSRAFAYFIRHLYDNFKHLLMDNLHWWYRNGFFASSAVSIGRKMELGDEHKNMIAHFIDCMDARHLTILI